MLARSYIAHGEQKRTQIDQMIRYAESNQCRMRTLVRHFGDLADGQRACGICDFCAAAQCAGQRFRTATEAERTALFRIVAAMRSGDVRSTGKLYRDLYTSGDMSRDTFEEVLGAMARTGLVQVTDAVFEKNGKQIPYRKVSLARAAYSINETTPIEFIMKETAAPARRKGKRKGAVAAKRKRTKRPETPGRPKPGTEDQRSEVGTVSRIEEALRVWRLTEARRLGVPAFRILSDQALRAMATRRPETARELLAIPGIAITTVEKYARQFYRILQKSVG